MVDVTIDTTGRPSGHPLSDGRHSVWSSDTVGYYFYMSSLTELAYRKTSNKGLTWGSEVSIATGIFLMTLSVWFDRWTPGDSGDFIHISFMRDVNDGIWYTSLDTTDDSLSIIKGVHTGVLGGGPRNFAISIAKARGGNLYIAYRDSSAAGTIIGMRRSTDGGVTWTARADPWSGEDHLQDWAMLYPGNEADNQDMWLIFWDDSVDEISLKTYDDSADSFSETLISGSMLRVSGTTHQMAGAIRHSDNHLILAAHTSFTPSGDLKVFDINGSGSITALTSIFTATINRIGTCLTVDNAPDDIYVAYLDAVTPFTAMQVLSHVSTDGGTSWSSAVTINDTDKQYRGLYSDLGSGVSESRWQPIFVHQGLAGADNEAFTNTGSSIQIGQDVSATAPARAGLIGGGILDRKGLG